MIFYMLMKVFSNIKVLLKLCHLLLYVIIFNEEMKLTANK